MRLRSSPVLFSTCHSWRSLVPTCTPYPLSLILCLPSPSPPVLAPVTPRRRDLIRHRAIRRAGHGPAPAVEAFGRNRVPTHSTFHEGHCNTLYPTPYTRATGVTPYTLHTTGDSAADTSASWGLSVEAVHVGQLGTLGRGRPRRPAGDTRSRPDTSTSCRASVKAGHVDQLGTLGRGRTRRPAGDTRSRPDTSTSCRASVKAGHVDQLGTLGQGRTRPPGRRSRLPRIRLKALEEPDFVEIGAKPARQDGQRGRRSGRGGVSCYLSRQSSALSAALPASGRILASCPARRSAPAAGRGPRRRARVPRIRSCGRPWPWPRSIVSLMPNAPSVSDVIR